ncbi:hypothetical protein HHL22_22740 [Hymenobacter sp. RP-2-7]|uniref:Uncharacterized protein n=1 Tax=Hymenobacter polaris TaxID=2682546 RepID=A0A7Y0FPV9_9BACT|nr:hypothetical protein [Hymenobacter polaris]NML68025.1 hypothetical protein [Hymenobacter polaris]
MRVSHPILAAALLTGGKALAQAAPGTSTTSGPISGSVTASANVGPAGQH